ncbi:PIN domain-containing protein [Limnoraphis robusta]|uniref:PIN domain-containing protein n=1 Tax=Limnoraphis robusta CS-951 TaxID=1637645 RepID=A0A0J9EYQ0_9CYAN|nr:PIN domain-containing protein [Limnoraphis robusta]KMW70330.1 hypothetical protein WN50_36135 [Limnoraphis robusta CS-951]
MLLDTHTLLWFLDDNPKLTPEIRDTIETADTVVVSIITLWEIAIKLSIQKLSMANAHRRNVNIVGYSGL